MEIDRWAVRERDPKVVRFVRRKGPRNRMEVRTL